MTFNMTVSQAGEGTLIRDEKVLPTVEEAVLEVQKEIEPETEREAGKETE